MNELDTSKSSGSSCQYFLSLANMVCGLPNASLIFRYSPMLNHLRKSMLVDTELKSGLGDPNTFEGIFPMFVGRY